MVPLVAWVLLVLGTVVEAHAAPVEVCVFSFNRPDEVEVFKSREAEEGFEVLDLSPHPGPPSEQAATGGATSWLSNVCRIDLQCDVVVYSAEFAGRFFGTSGTSVGQQEMEEASCQPECAGIFHRPREVFLMGCNTLATKDQDRRSPAEYLDVLLEHGFDRASAERVVALRYGPLGPSFREAHRRIFMGVGRIYGFSSVAPTGERTAPLLERYLRSKGDYGHYLARGATGPNRELLAAFRGTALVETAGLSPSEPAAADRADICGLYDESRSVVQRLGIVEQLLDRPDFLAFLPTIEVFVTRHPPQQLRGEERKLFAEIQRHEAARDQVLQLVRELNVSALTMELAHLALQLKWKEPTEFRRLAVAGARELLERPLTSEVVDVMYEISKHESIGDQFASEALPERLVRDAEGLRLLDCLSPVDKRVSVRLLAGLDSPDLPTRLWAGYALSRRLPLEDDVLLHLAVHLTEATPLHERLRWIFRAQAPLSDEVRRAVATRDPQLADEIRLHAKYHRGEPGPSS